MRDVLTRLEQFAPQFDISKGLGMSTFNSVQNVIKIVNASKSVDEFSRGFAKHVMDPTTVQTSILFGSGKLSEKKIIGEVRDLLRSLGLIFVLAKSTVLLSQNQTEETPSSKDVSSPGAKRGPLSLAHLHNDADQDGGISYSDLDFSGSSGSDKNGNAASGTDLTDQNDGIDVEDIFSVISSVADMVDGMKFDLFDDSIALLQSKITNLPFFKN